MKQIRFLFFFIPILFINLSLSQNNENEINKKLNSLFLNIDTSIKPEKIENEYRVAFDYDSKKNEPEKNILTFRKHPFVTNFYLGKLNTTYLFDKKYFEEFGLYKVKMTLYFFDNSECLAEYRKIVENC